MGRMRVRSILIKTNVVRVKFGSDCFTSCEMQEPEKFFFISILNIESDKVFVLPSLTTKSVKI